MKTSLQCRCPGCDRIFNAAESSYSATLLKHDGGTLSMAKTLLCRRCSYHATNKTHLGEMIIKRLLQQASAAAPADLHIVR